MIHKIKQIFEGEIMALTLPFRSSIAFLSHASAHKYSILSLSAENLVVTIKSENSENNCFTKMYH